MSFDPLTAVFDIGGKLIDRLWPDPEQRDKAKLQLMEMQQKGELATLASETELAKAQMAINAEEARSSSLFVAGWRPMVGWTCAGGLLYHTILQPFIVFLMVAAGREINVPEFDTMTLITLLGGMLGFGSMRTFERIKGKS